MLPIVQQSAEYWTEPFADCFRRRSRQSPPYKEPASYSFYRYFGTRDYWTWTPSSSSSTFTKMANFAAEAEPALVSHMSHCYNAAYAQLQDRISDNTGWAENVAQAGKAREMFNNRAEQIARFALALRRGRFKDAARQLRTPLPSGVSHRKAVAQNFLEYEFGLKPLMSDLLGTMDVLGGDPEVRLVRGRSSVGLHRVTRQPSSGPGFISWSDKTQYLEHKVEVGARVRVDNPNLFLAVRLGLLDLALPWKMVPFSFVVDWFINVEQMISSTSDWFGLHAEAMYTSKLSRGTQVWSMGGSSWNISTKKLTGSSKDYREASSVRFDRTLGISGPSFAFKPFRGMSLQRGAQALSLVLAVLGK